MLGQQAPSPTEPSGQPHPFFLFMWVQGIKLKSSHLQQKHCTSLFGDSFPSVFEATPGTGFHGLMDGARVPSIPRKQITWLPKVLAATLYL